MDRPLNYQGDYATPASGDVASLSPSVYRRLQTELGSYWADLTLGSRLHELRRAKDLPTIGPLAVQYARQALAPILADGRAKQIDIGYQHPADGYLTLHIDILTASGQRQYLQHPIPI